MSGTGDGFMTEEEIVEMPVGDLPLGIDPGLTAIDVSGANDGKLWRELLTTRDIKGESDEVGIHCGMEIKVYYIGKLLDGTIFDQSDRNASPFKFTVGEGSVIEGWDKGLLGLKRGDVVKLICHPDVAYKNQAQGKIPANSTLIFEVEIVDYDPIDLTKKKNGCILKYNLKLGEIKYLNPNHGSEIQVTYEAKVKDKVLVPKKTETFRLGEGCEIGIPFGVEKALYKFRVGEQSVVIVKGPRYGLPKEALDAHGLAHNTPVSFTVELISNKNSKEPWQLSGAEKLEASRELKATGNKFFSKQNYRVAQKNYKLIIDHLKAEALLEGEEEEERKALLLAANLNQAICHIKMGKPTLAIRNCDDALDLDGVNTKGFYRRGLAKMDINDPEGAKADFQRVLELEPANAAVLSKLAACEQQLKENFKKEKQMYSKMFSQMGNPVSNGSSD